MSFVQPSLPPADVATKMRGLPPAFISFCGPPPSAPPPVFRCGGAASATEARTNPATNDAANLLLFIGKPMLLSDGFLFNGTMNVRWHCDLRRGHLRALTRSNGDPPWARDLRWANYRLR